MKRTGFLKRKAPLRQTRRAGPDKPKPKPMAKASVQPLHRGTYSGGTSGKAVQKEKPARSEEYRRLVAALPCWLCGIEGHSQAAHADMGKGMSTKADDRTCFAACGPHDGLVGCHYSVGSTGLLTKAERRALEQKASADTRRQIAAMGLWPKTLPAWGERTGETT